MVEVFKTNVNDYYQANKLIDLIHSKFKKYKASFDLEDCDNVLRVACENCEVRFSAIVGLLRNHGFDAEVLRDEVPDLKSVFSASVDAK